MAGEASAVPFCAPSTPLIYGVWEIRQPLSAAGRQFYQREDSGADNRLEVEKFPSIPEPTSATVGDDRWSRQKPGLKKDLLGTAPCKDVWSSCSTGSLDYHS